MKTNWKLEEYIYFFGLIPLILLIIFFSLNIFKANFKLNLFSPQLINIFFSNYDHINLNHLIGNLFFYLMILGIIFYLETNKKLFLKISLLGLFILPFLLFLLQKIIFGIFDLSYFPPLSGFSGIVSFFMGYLIYVFYKNYREKLPEKININLFYILVFSGAVFWSFSYSKAIFLLSSLILCCLILLNISQIKNIILLELSNLRKSKNKFLSLIHLGILLFNLGLIIFSMAILIPQKILDGNTLTNILVHYIGYLIGLFSPFLIDNVNRFKFIELIKKCS